MPSLFPERRGAIGSVSVEHDDCRDLLDAGLRVDMRDAGFGPPGGAVHDTAETARALRELLGLRAGAAAAVHLERTMPLVATLLRCEERMLQEEWW